MKQSHEERCKAEFDKLARNIFPRSQFTWEEVKNDPPDWFLTIENIRYAVEATTIVELLESTGYQFSSVDISASLHGFVKSVEKAAINEGILNGAYAVILCPIPNFSQNQRKLRDDLMRYIRETRDLPNADEYTLGYVRHQRVSIQKMHSNTNYIAETISYGGKWESDAQKDLAQFVAQALSQKADKLRHVTDPIILLLLDGYHYSFMADWNSAVNACDSRVQFEVICRVLADEPSTILWSRSSNWNS
jgi:hypothetical protein